MARILLSAAMNRPWSPGHALLPALEHTGHEIRVVDPEGSEHPADELRSAVDAFHPRLHVVYGGRRYPLDLVEELRDRGIFQILWFPEVTPNPRPETVELGRAYDLFFTMAQGLVDRFAAAGIPNVAWLPEAMEPSLFEYDTATDVDRQLYTCDITLVGKLESDNPAYMERWKLVKRIVDEDFNIKWWGPRLRRKIGTFVLGLLLSKVSRAYGGRFVWNETYAKAIHLSKVFIARDAYPSIRLSMSSRAFTALGLGAFYLTYPTRGIEELFEPDRELVLFNSPDEMVEKIRYYLGRDRERTAIANAAREKVLACHTYAHRFDEMLRVCRKQGCDLE
jgi:spore maturation protein CgeB